MRRVIRFVSVSGISALVLLCCASSAALTWAVFFEQPWLEYRNLPFPTRQPAVFAPGEVVPLTVERCSRADQVRVYRTTHSLQRLDSPGGHVVLPAVEVNIAPGCTVGESRINVLPGDLAPGHYRVMGAAVVPGLLRDHVVGWHSSAFEVLAPEPAMPEPKPRPMASPELRKRRG